ncbi:hypothetical protein [Brevibacillus parabrevis]|uniref:Helix-turn-helix type 11 domain-containing protein n=1 Tax=Brevibacillus parabrevis TaxID=54914 RepID=A0A4Y3PPF6_BREPA|nr:hypothetical protein [Brevibacillus parabrevis]RNB94423.1 hypothetical protein EDM60_18720 [Brevibacillus parabrevis]GEB35293.1 hypothetical protein BPA01_48730 [Brevibacillus parabrevis]
MSQKQALSPEVIEEITRAAVQAAMEFQEKKKQKQQKEKRDWRLRNTKLLLKHYRSFVSHVEGAREQVTAMDYADAMESLYTDELALESIKRSRQRTIVMVKFVRKMIGVYQAMCEASGQQEDLRRYHIVHELYISEKKQTVEELAEFHNIEPRTVYNDVKNAVKTLSVLVFGVDGIEFN